MLYLPPSTSRLIRAQGVLVTDDEIRRLVEFVSAQGPPAFDAAMHEKLQLDSAPVKDISDEDEELVEKCLEIIRQEKRASTSLLQLLPDFLRCTVISHLQLHRSEHSEHIQTALNFNGQGRIIGRTPV